MKKIHFMTVMLLLLTLNFASYSQSTENAQTPSANSVKKSEKQGYQTLLNNGRYISRGFHFGMNLGHTMIAKRNAGTVGFNFAWVIDHTLELGIAGKGFISTPKPDSDLYNYDYFYSGGYGGLYLAGNIFGSKPINISIPVTVGWGGVAYAPTHYDDYIENYHPDKVCSFFVVEPGLDIQFNMTRGFRLSVGVSYRYTSDIYMVFNNNSNQNIIRNKSLNGFNTNIKFKFGRF
ncbi:MAG: hypothetical protein LBQ22_07775 [Bacteroidales bacterium]|jgi:hypothetical protein|nr:hypothetical protein [Bacteroidales bacterium]